MSRFPKPLFWPYGTGYSAPDSLDALGSDSSLQLGDVGESPLSLEDVSGLFPETLTLRVSMRAARIDGPGLTSLHRRFPGETLAPVLLYSPEAVFPGKEHVLETARHKSLSLVALSPAENPQLSELQGRGVTLASDPGEALYTHHFATEPPGLIQETHFLEQDTIQAQDTQGQIAIPSSQNLLRPYGGVLDANPAACVQVYYSLADDGARTKIHLTENLANLEDYVLRIPHPIPSLKQAIEQGAIHLALKNTEESLTQAYCSRRYQIAGEAPSPILDITFTKAIT